MKVLIVFAHPEKRSFNGSLLKTTVQFLESQRHTVRVSNLYEENFQPLVTEDDFPLHEKDTRFQPIVESRRAAEADNAFTDDVLKAQEDLKWADFVIFQFPLWWFNMPAILKGWFDRVYMIGFAYCLPQGDFYGKGLMEGKKAMLLVTVGERCEQYSDRGIHGPIDDLLFPITHGLLWYTGFEVLKNFFIWRTDKADEKLFEDTVARLHKTLSDINSIEAIPFRTQTTENCNFPQRTYKEGIELSGTSGFDIHLTEKISKK